MLMYSHKWLITCLTIALSLNLLGIILSFYVLCGTTFYQTGLCYQPLYRDFTSETRLSQPVSNEISLTQEIQVTCDGLTELRVLLIPSIAEDGGTTRLILRDPWGGQTLISSAVTNDQIPVETWYSLRFDPDWRSAGKKYILKIFGTNSPAGQGLRFLYSPQSEFDVGNLYENGELLPEDTVLQYGCITGLRKIWQTGRP
jgi:hypothetical protein